MGMMLKHLLIYNCVYCNIQETDADDSRPGAIYLHPPHRQWQWLKKKREPRDRIMSPENINLPKCHHLSLFLCCFYFQSHSLLSHPLPRTTFLSAFIYVNPKFPATPSPSRHPSCKSITRMPLDAARNSLCFV